jgi:hypothetical protein
MRKAFNLLYHDYIVRTLRNIITNILGRGIQPISLNLNLKNPPHLYIKQAYITDAYPPSVPKQPNRTVSSRTRLYHAAWRPKDFIYTNASQVTSNPTMGASKVNPTTHIITHIEIKSQLERHTSNRTEVTVITLALEAN